MLKENGTGLVSLVAYGSNFAIKERGSEY